MGATWTGLRVGETASDHVRGLLDGLDVVAQGTAVGDSDYRWVHYAAVREDDESIVAYVTPFTQSEGGVLYKTFTERSLPFFYTAPANVMAALTPTDNECANEWRAKVRERAASNYGPTRLRDGMRVRFSVPFRGVGDTLVARKVGRTWRFMVDGSPNVYTLRGWTRIAWREVA